MPLTEGDTSLIALSTPPPTPTVGFCCPRARGKSPATGNALAHCRHRLTGVQPLSGFRDRAEGIA
jgi:hypothetical protein